MLGVQGSFSLPQIIVPSLHLSPFSDEQSHGMQHRAEKLYLTHQEFEFQSKKYINLGNYKSRVDYGNECIEENKRKRAYIQMSMLCHIHS